MNFPHPYTEQPPDPRRPLHTLPCPSLDWKPGTEVTYVLVSVTRDSPAAGGSGVPPARLRCTGGHPGPRTPASEDVPAATASSAHALCKLPGNRECWCPAPSSLFPASVTVGKNAQIKPPCCGVRSLHSCNKLPQTAWLKRHEFTTLQSCRTHIQNASLGLELRLQGRSRSLPSPVSRNALLPWPASVSACDPSSSFKAPVMTLSCLMVQDHLPI